MKTGGASRSTAVFAELRGLVVDNFIYKLVAFLFAITIWAWVQSEQVVQERVRVPLRWTVAEGLVPAEAPLDSVTVTFEGVQAFVRTVRQKELGIGIDLSTASEGEVNVELGDRPIQGLPEHVRVVAVSPTSLRLTLDRVLRRKVPVEVATRGEVAAGHALRSITVEPDRVELVGPSVALRALDSVRTDPVDLTALREPAEFEVGLALKKGAISLAKPTPLLVKVQVEAVLEERRFDSVPVVLRTPGAWEVSPSVVGVVLRGPPEVLGKVGGEDVSVLVYVPEEQRDAADVVRGAEGLRFEVVHPGGDAVTVGVVEPATIRLEPKAP